MSLSTLKALSLAGAVLLATAVSAGTLIDQNARTTHAFVLLQADIKDLPTFFQRYAVPAEVEVMRYGGQALFGSQARDVIEGDWPGNWTLVLRFPSLRAVHDWYGSAGYQAVLPYRHQATAWGRMVAIEGLPESSLNWRLDRRDGAAVNLTFPGTLDTTPEYVVTTTVNWPRGDGGFALSADFPPVDASRATLKFELSVSSAQPTGLTEVTPILRDQSGHRWRLARRLLSSKQRDGWQTFAMPIVMGITAVADTPARSAPRPIQSIELEFRHQGLSPETTQIRVRNLALTR